MLAIAYTLIGVLVGGLIGACAGFFTMRAVTELSEMSCYQGDPEGSCILTAFLAGLCGMLTGAAAGLRAVFWRARHYRASD